MSNYIRQSRQQSLGDVDAATADRTLKAALTAQPGTYAIAYLDRSGTVSKIDTFATSVAMSTAWDAMVDGNAIPSTVQEIMWLDKSAPAGEGWNIATNPSGTLTFSKINWKSAAPWILGGAALIALAVYYKKKPAKGRRRAGWRRRTVTVWR